MSVVLGILIVVAWVLAIENCIESRRAKNIALVTLLLCSIWIMQAAIKRLDCTPTGVIAGPSNPMDLFP